MLIVGGGLIGCCTAWHLARGGASVLLLEAGQLNAGASGQNAGSLHFQIERRFLEQGEAKAAEAARVVGLNRLAIDDWRGLEGELGVDVHVHMNGGLMVAETAAEAAMLEAKVRQEAEHGLATQILDAAGVQRIAPYLSDRVCAAAFSPDEGHADPRSLTPAFAAAARAAGAQILTDAPVLALQKRPSGGFSASFGGANGQRHGEIVADRVLVAAGVWTAHIAALANLHMPLYPVALLMNVNERAAPFMPHLVQHVGQRLSMKQADAGNVLIGGGWPSVLRRQGGAFDLGARPDMKMTSLTANLDIACRIVPRAADLNLIRSWTGKTAVSADQLPIAGQVPRMPGFFVAAGGSAFTLGPTLARLVAGEMLSDQPDPRLDVVSPARFEHLNSFMG